MNFPKEVYNYCPKVAEAKRWLSDVTEDEMSFHAECAFTSNMKCENCGKVITEPELVGKIKEFYSPPQPINFSI